MQKIINLYLCLLSASLQASDPEKYTRKKINRVDRALYQLECAIEVKKPDIEWLGEEIARAFIDLGPLGKQTEYPDLFARAAVLNHKLTVLLEAQKRPVTITISDA